MWANSRPTQIEKNRHPEAQLVRQVKPSRCNRVSQSAHCRLADVLASADRCRGPDGAARREPQYAPSLSPLHVQFDLYAEGFTVTITVK